MIIDTAPGTSGELPQSLSSIQNDVLRLRAHKHFSTRRSNNTGQRLRPLAAPTIGMAPAYLHPYFRALRYSPISKAKQDASWFSIFSNLIRRFHITSSKELSMTHPIGIYLPEQKGIFAAVIGSLNGKGLDALIVAGDSEGPTIIKGHEWHIHPIPANGCSSNDNGDENTRAMADAGSDLAKEVIKHKGALPARDELMAIAINDRGLFQGPMGSNWYWSSTQVATDAVIAVEFTLNAMGKWEKSGNKLRALAVRRVPINSINIK